MVGFFFETYRFSIFQTISIEFRSQLSIKKTKMNIFLVNDRKKKPTHKQGSFKGIQPQGCTTFLRYTTTRMYNI